MPSTYTNRKCATTSSSHIVMHWSKWKDVDLWQSNIQLHGFYENRIMSLLHCLKQRANRDLKLISNQDTLSVLMSCQLAWNRWHMFCVQAFETNHQLKLMLNLKLTQSYRISSGTIFMIRGKNDLYNIWYDLFVMCGMLTLPCSS